MNEQVTIPVYTCIKCLAFVVDFDEYNGNDGVCNECAEREGEYPLATTHG